MNPQEEVSRPVKQAWNWRIWAGFLVALAVIPSYFVFFAKYPPRETCQGELAHVRDFHMAVVDGNP
jgi:hypothetical protein